MELEQRAQAAEAKHAETVANINLKQQDQDRKAHEAHMHGVQAAHDMAASDIDQQQNQQIAQLQQQIAELQAAAPGQQQGEGE
jgi:hypothetical protein